MGKAVMTSRERVLAAVDHQKPDRIPFDLGGTEVSTLSTKAYQNLRRELGLPDQPAELTQLFMFTAKVDEEVRKMMGFDCVPLIYPVDSCGNRMDGRMQVFTANDGATAYISVDSVWDRLEDGSIVMYPQGDRSVPPSMIMLNDSEYFDNILGNLPDWDEDDLDARRDWAEDFLPIPDDIAKELEEESIRLYEETDAAVIGMFPYAFLGDAGTIPGYFVRHPKGIRRPEDFLMATLLYPEYIEESFELQTEVAMENLKIYKDAVGDRIQIIRLSTADYGSQNGPLISPNTFRELYKPFYKKMNDWIHANTNWRIMFHSCGSIIDLLDDYVDMGCDIINPVQISAHGMDPQRLKDGWGDKLTFWGGGADSQGVLSFGTPEEVRAQVRERMSIFSPGGGYVFNPVHNIMPDTRMENLLAMIDEVHRFNDSY